MVSSCVEGSSRRPDASAEYRRDLCDPGAGVSAERLQCRNEVAMGHSSAELGPSLTLQLLLRELLNLGQVKLAANRSLQNGQIELDLLLQPAIDQSADL